MLRTRLLPLVVGLLLGAPSPAAPTSQSAAVTATASIGALAKLTLSSVSVAFPDADPDTVPFIPSLGGPLIVTAKARTIPGGTVRLTVLAQDDLRSGTHVIPASALRWTASGPGFVGGTASTAAEQPLGSWTGSGVWTGEQQYLLENRWSYAVGTYSMTLTYTLAAP
jgi:hypothetical protein